MSNPDSNTVNPYQAPQASQPEGVLPFDTEFLLSDTCALCDGDVHLPRVCVVSGATDDLVERTGTLWFTPVWIIFMAVMLGLATPAAIGLSSEVYRAVTRGGQAENEVYVFLFVYGALMFMTIYAAFLFRRKVSASWYISNRLVRKYRSGVLISGVVFAVLAVAQFLLFGELDHTITGLVGLAFLSFLFNKPQRPRLRGTHEGLNVVMGLSPEFLQRVQAIIDRHNSKSVQ